MVLLKVLWDSFTSRAARAEQAAESWQRETLQQVQDRLRELETGLQVARERVEGMSDNYRPRLAEVEKTLSEHERRLARIEGKEQNQ